MPQCELQYCLGDLWIDLRYFEEVSNGYLCGVGVQVPSWLSLGACFSFKASQKWQLCRYELPKNQGGFWECQLWFQPLGSQSRLACLFVEGSATDWVFFFFKNKKSCQCEAQCQPSQT